MLVARIVLSAHTEFFIFFTGIFELTHCVWVIMINVIYSVYWQDIYIYRVFHDLWTLMQEVIS